MAQHTTDALVKISDNLSNLTKEITALEQAHKTLSDTRNMIVSITDSIARLRTSKEPYALEIVMAIKTDLKAVINDGC